MMPAVFSLTPRVMIQIRVGIPGQGLLTFFSLWFSSTIDFLLVVSPALSSVLEPSDEKKLAIYAMMAFKMLFGLSRFGQVRELPL